MAGAKIILAVGFLAGILALGNTSPESGSLDTLGALKLTTEKPTLESAPKFAPKSAPKTVPKAALKAESKATMPKTSDKTAGKMSAREDKANLDKLFSENPTPAQKERVLKSIETKPFIKRKQAVKFSPGAFSQNKLTKGNKIEINLFDDKNIKAVLKKTKEKSGGRLIWKGGIEGDDSGTVTIVKNGNTMVGVIHGKDGDYEIKDEGDGIQSIIEIDQNKFPKHLHRLPARPSGVTARVSPPEPATVATPVTIDLLALYTPRALDRAGGSRDEMEATIEAYVEDANTIFENSGILVNINLAGDPVQISYTETTDGYADHERLTEPNDGYMDNVHALRDERQADIVYLIEGPRDDFCGVAWQMNRDNWDYFDSSAFGLVRLGCLSNHVLAHEIGHTFGVAHNREDAEHTPYETFGYGYRSQWIRTIMSYPCELTDCNLIPLFSSSRRTIGSGTAIGSDDTDGARAMNSARNIVAGFRGDLPIKNFRNF